MKRVAVAKQMACAASPVDVLAVDGNFKMVAFDVRDEMKNIVLVVDVGKHAIRQEPPSSGTSFKSLASEVPTVTWS